MSTAIGKMAFLNRNISILFNSVSYHCFINLSFWINYCDIIVDILCYKILHFLTINTFTSNVATSISLKFNQNWSFLQKCFRYITWKKKH